MGAIVKDKKVGDDDTMTFQSVLQVDVPKGREGKHKKIITQLLSDLSHLQSGSALKVPLAKLPDTKENIRSALSRAAQQKDLKIATSSNDEYLYIWKAEETS
jgi:hypothetical protein